MMSSRLEDWTRCYDDQASVKKEDPQTSVFGLRESFSISFTRMDTGKQPAVTQPAPPAYPGPSGYETKQAGGYLVQPGYPVQPVVQGQPPGTTIIHTQPAQLLVGMGFYENPVAMTCPYCQASIVTATTYEPGSLTWIACGGVALMG